MSYGFASWDAAGNPTVSITTRTARLIAALAVSVTTGEKTATVAGVNTSTHFALCDNGAHARVSGPNTVTYLGGSYTTGSTTLRVFAL